ncbi:MAG: response regulator [Planctomycetota bacterium]|nr:response regulator [Planctomycetota bacterium]
MANKKTVIVIDDDPDVLEATKVTLEGSGYAAVTALSGPEGLSRIRQGGIDCIILDVMMARETEGFHLAQDLKADSKTAKIPIIMMTSVSKKTGFEFSPATDKDFMPVEVFLEKPVDPKKLVQTVASVIKG